ncbi:hypothetical protein PR202_ga21504 [Eleusine coracana subsp. coracana]|uniref:Transcription factor GAMYB n=1 Tax=Eleusine coracana subsp. coracana TaxID=191504 RepID=A0AAV5D1N3_ELECO|nr:hypothetical protein PR202_ga21504 [Eleusine coracana subsp. coracana]
MSPRRRRGDGSRWKKGAWSPEEDEVLRQHVAVHGAESWSVLQSNGLIDRPGKSCRLRWVNKLRPGLKQGKFSPSEERMVLDLQAKHGNKWALIASHLAGRTDNDVKNFWSTRQKRLARRLLLPPPQLLQEPPRRKRSPHGQRGRGSSSSALSLELCDPQEPSYAMITFQSTTYEVGQSSSQVQEPHEVKHCIDALLPGVIYLPAPPAATMEPGSSSMVPYGNYSQNPVLRAGADLALLEDYEDLKIPCISRQEPSSCTTTFHSSTYEVDQISIAPSGANNNEDPLRRAGVGLAALHYAAFVEPEAVLPSAPLSFGMNFRDAPAVEPQESVKPADPFSCLGDYYAVAPRRGTSGMRFGDLSPETLAFFDQHVVRVQNGRASG